MLRDLGVNSMEELISQTVPESIRLRRDLDIPGARTESELLADLKKIAEKNQLMRNFIGCGYYGTHTPGVILRNVMESPQWYTPYTPYQPEIAQGRLESLLNFQTMVSEMTGLPMSNASLLDEATAGAEAMSMCFAIHKQSAKRSKFFVSETLHPQTIALLETRAPTFGIEIVRGDWQSADFSAADYCGAIVQNPATDGTIADFTEFCARAHEHKTRVVLGTDLLALTMMKSPFDMGADIAYGSAQRFGVPLGYGGPHAAFLSTRDEFKRTLPGRIIGVSKDMSGGRALRMALQVREQHIRRDKATSNICTAQALLANMAAMYAVYHGPIGLAEIGARTNLMAKTLVVALAKLGYRIPSTDFFDTVKVECNASSDRKSVV